MKIIIWFPPFKGYNYEFKFCKIAEKDNEAISQIWSTYNCIGEISHYSYDKFYIYNMEHYPLREGFERLVK